MEYIHLQLSSRSNDVRVLNILRLMIVEPDILEKEDIFIFERIKEFIATEEVSRLAAAKQLLILVERAVCVDYQMH